MTTTYFETSSPATMKLLLAATLFRCSICHRLKAPRNIALGTRLLERKLDRPLSRGPVCAECARFLAGKWEERRDESGSKTY